ncbi:MAG: gas vesicle protein [Cyanobacteria bacterium J06592_8]
MPRTHSEASEQLELYKMVTKRERILQEMQITEQRLAALKQQLVAVDTQIKDSEENIQKLRQSPLTSTSSTTSPPPRAKTAQKESKSTTSQFQTFNLDY